MILWNCVSPALMKQRLDGEFHPAALSLIIPYAKVTSCFSLSLVRT